MKLMKGKKPSQITAERVVTTSFIVDVSDILINTFVAVITKSVVMQSQALEGLADLIASGFLLIGVKRSKQPLDRRHPYGYGRELYFWTFLSALATFSLAASFSFFIGLRRFLNPEKITRIGLSFGALFLTIVTNGYAMSLSFKRLLGKNPEIKVWQALFYPALIETKTAFVLDLMGTIASIFGFLALLIYQLTGELKFDGLGAMVVGITLAILALFIIKAAKDLLVGQSASLRIEGKIVKAAQSCPNVKKVISLRTLHVGPKRLLVNMEVNLTDKLTTSEIEKIIDKIEGQIKEEVPSATNIQIELETPDVNQLS